MDRWTFTFAASLVLAIGFTGFAGASTSSPTVVTDVPVKTAWPSLTKPTPLTP